MQYTTFTLKNPSLEETIESKVFTACTLAIDPYEFHIYELSLTVNQFFGNEYSYKQIRDALYRMRHKRGIEHCGRGWYRWTC